MAAPRSSARWSRGVVALEQGFEVEERLAPAGLLRVPLVGTGERLCRTATVDGLGTYRVAVEANQRPIGWWLKHLDGLLEQALGEAIADLGLDRRRWQVLNVLRRGATTPAEIGVALAPFWDASDDEVEELLADLHERGWVERRDGTVLTTEAGESVRTLAAERVEVVRARSTEGITPEAYQTTMATLERMATNLTS